MNQCVLCSASTKLKSKFNTCRHFLCSECITQRLKEDRACPICKQKFRKNKKFSPAAPSKNKSEVPNAGGVPFEQASNQVDANSLTLTKNFTKGLLKQLMKVNGVLKQAQKNLKVLVKLRTKMQEFKDLSVEEIIGMMNLEQFQEDE